MMRFIKVQKGSKRFKTTIGVLGVIAFLVMGFFALAPQPTKTAYAQAVTPSVCTNCPFGSPVCAPLGTVNISTQAILSAIQSFLEAQFNNFTAFFAAAFDNFIGALLQEIQDFVEGLLMLWQDGWYDYDLRTSLQNVMGQFNTLYIEQSRLDGSLSDAESMGDTIATYGQGLNQSHREMRPSGQVCSTGTVAGVFSRGNSFARAMRQASGRDSTARDGNAAGSTYETGPAEAVAYQWDRYCGFLVDPANNDGQTGCPAPGATNPEVRNADIEPTRFLYDQYTIDVTRPEVAAALEAVKENLVGIVPPDVVPENLVDTAPGQDMMMTKRSFIARRNAARAPIEKVSSMRMPIADDTAGANDIESYVKEIKTAANIPAVVFDGPVSMREILNVVANEKFTTGDYALNNIDTPLNLRRESLTLSAFHLMALREKFEIMERGALALAVQTSIEIDIDADDDQIQQE